MRQAPHINERQNSKGNTNAQLKEAKEDRKEKSRGVQGIASIGKRTADGARRRGLNVVGVENARDAV